MKVNTVDIFTVFSFSMHKNDIAVSVLVNGEQSFLQGKICVLQPLPIFVL